jgi:hypothetical protein
MEDTGTRLGSSTLNLRRKSYPPGRRWPERAREGVCGEDKHVVAVFDP